MGYGVSVSPRRLGFLPVAGEKPIPKGGSTVTIRVYTRSSILIWIYLNHKYGETVLQKGVVFQRIVLPTVGFRTVPSKSRLEAFIEN